MQPKFLILLYLINYVLMDNLDIYYLSILVLFSHCFNFVKFILPNQVSTTGFDVLKTPEMLNQVVLWSYGTGEDEELFD